MLVRSCFLITLSKCLKSHKSLLVFVKVANEEANFVMDMEVEKVANIMVNKFPIDESGKIVKKVKE